MRFGASTATYYCSFPGHVDTVEALLRLRLRTIRDLHKELQRLLLEGTIDYDHYIDVLNIGQSTTTTTSTRSSLDQIAPTLLSLHYASSDNDL